MTSIVNGIRDTEYQKKSRLSLSHNLMNPIDKLKSGLGTRDDNKTKKEAIDDGRYITIIYIDINRMIHPSANNMSVITTTRMLRPCRCNTSVFVCIALIMMMMTMMMTSDRNGILLVPMVHSFSMISSFRHISRLSSTTSDTVTTTATTTASKSNVVIVSPPGGIGEVTAVKVAQQGYHVKWLVIRNSIPNDSSNTNSYNSRMPTSPSEESVVSLSQEILNDIQNVGGSLQFAGADTVNLLSTDSSSTSSSSGTTSSSLQAITTWCNVADAVICTIDGVEGNMLPNKSDSKKRQPENDNDTTLRNEWKNAIYLATRAVATKSIAATKIAILSASEQENDNDINNNDNNRNNNGLLSPLTNLFNGGTSSSSSGNSNNNMNVPTSLTESLMTSSSNDTNNNIIKLRHGQVLFGLAETSKEFTPFLNGPRKVPELCSEYSNRNIRIDPTFNVNSGTNMFLVSSSSSSSSSNTATTNIDTTMSSRTSRHAMGDAVVTILNMMQENHNSAPLWPTKEGTLMDVCVTSQPGTDIVTPEEWKNEFQRVISVLSSSGDGTSSASTNAMNGIPLFNVEFGSVPNIDRFTDWMTTKWAPAILRTYDIAAIRTGPRPVYANRIRNEDSSSDSGTLEIVWQQLINFEPVIIGRMMIEITNTNMKASRIIEAAGSSTTNRNNMMSLAGEDILVRRLAEAASQAIEKGLATKVCIGLTYLFVNLFSPHSINVQTHT